MSIEQELRDTLGRLPPPRPTPFLATRISSRLRTRPKRSDLALLFVVPPLLWWVSSALDGPWQMAACAATLAVTAERERIARSLADLAAVLLPAD